MYGKDVDPTHHEPTTEHLSHFALMAHIDRAIAAAVHKHELENGREIERFTREVNELKAQVNELKIGAGAGFPNDDAAAHRRVHEHYIKEAQDRDAMVRGTKHKVLELTVWAGVLLMANAVWDYIKAHLK